MSVTGLKTLNPESRGFSRVFCKDLWGLRVAGSLWSKGVSGFHPRGLARAISGRVGEDGGRSQKGSY